MVSSILFIGLELPFVAFHVSVLICVLQQMKRKNRTFSTSFFVIYAQQSVAEVVYYCLNNYFRLSREGITPKFLVDSPSGNVGYALFSYCFNYQFMGHAVVALNRYCVITGTRTELWHGRRVRSVYVLLALLPIPAVIPRCLSRVTLVQASPGVYAMVFEQPWVSGAVAFTSLIYLMVSSFVSIFFEARTLLAYRRLGLLKRKQSVHDFHLLVFALTQLISQVGYTFYFSLLCVAAASTSRWISGVLQTFSPFLIAFTSLSGPICLFVSSRQLRQSYLDQYISLIVTLTGQSETSVFTTGQPPQSRWA